MDRLTAIEIFVEVARAGSFAAVAERFAMTPAMIGKYIKWLEARVGSRLLNRNTRCQSLTEAGQEYLAGCQSLLQHYRALEQNTLANTGQAAGRIRINAPVTFGSYRLTPLLCRFMKRYPQIRIELDLSDRLVDVIGDGFDLIFRIGQPKDAGYIARPLTSTGSVFCASPDYLQRHGTPLTLADLASHHCLGFSPWLGQSRLAEAFPLEQLHLWDSPFISNHGGALKVAALNHAGILLQPRALLSEELERGTLQEILADALPAPRPVNLLYPAREPLPLRLRLLIDYLVEQRHQL
ncbi:LysR family transcriptional regulator [Aeromonas dhakensis]|uniref:LysR family transcriptional regulator n=1 Tax=Aeromonas dhakensis TaxID=196024 RepID=UPI00227A635D|nr:LysR family transcriptional regulator [Aeromonas dhakensis]WAF97858.1 LysR family transcriptional regulator [Aeromonas dhakensis]